MNVQLVFFAIAGIMLGRTSALKNGLNFPNAKIMYDQISSQVRVPLNSETSGVRSVIETMEDLQKRFQENQPRNHVVRDDRTTGTTQFHHQSHNRVSSEVAIPLNRRDELIEINKRIVPSSLYTDRISSRVINPFLNEKSLAVDRHNSFEDRRQSLNQRQIYQNRQLEKFNLQKSYDNRNQHAFPHSVYNNKQQEFTGQRSVYNINQKDSNAQQFSNSRQQPSFPQQSYDRSVYNINQKDSSAQQFSNSRQQPSFPQQSYDRKRETIVQRSTIQETLLPGRSYDNNQDISTQKSFIDRQQGISTQKSFTDRQQGISTPKSFTDNQQGISTQKSFTDRQQESTTQRSNSNEVVRKQQFHHDVKLLIPQLANNDQLLSQQLPESQPQIISHHQLIRKVEVNGNIDRPFNVANLGSQIFNTPSHLVNSQKSIGGQLRFGFLRRDGSALTTTEQTEVLPQMTNTEPLSDQNEDTKIVPSIATEVPIPVSTIEVDSSSTRGASVRQHLKTPFADYSFSHLL